MAGYRWVLRGVSSNLRYTTRQEKKHLDQHLSTLGSLTNNFAALIAIKKSEEWWLLTQDERREIIEDRSHHIDMGVKYITAISRKLYHSRDIGETFDFLTWFEFNSKHVQQFNELVDYLRSTEEWKYVIRETDIRLQRINVI